MVLEEQGGLDQMVIQLGTVLVVPMEATAEEMVMEVETATAEEEGRESLGE